MKNEEYNVRNVIFNADFEVELAKDLFWVPINSLGKTRFTNDYFLNLIDFNLTYVQEVVGNVYEAIQFLNALKFRESKDVSLVESQGIIWEYHCSGIEAIKNKSGCCTSVASALKFLCEKSYDYLGFIYFVRQDSSNHVLCYILMDGTYFIFDPSAYVYGDLEDIVLETGEKKDIMGKLFTSVCIKTTNINNFVKFYQRILLYNDHKFIFFNFFDSETSIEKVALELKENSLNIYLPENKKHNIIGNHIDFFKVNII